MTKLWRAAAGIVLSVLVLAVAVGPSLAYVDQRQVKLTLLAPYSVACDQKVAITAKVISLRNGKPVANQAIDWSLILRQSPGDRLSPARTYTNRLGTATVRLAFANRAGKRIVQGRVPGLKPQVTIRCRPA